ncbi:hypothetical protein Pla52o_04490 [Novipirellula galeiformis]|uniref:Uncharacterized protein n=1 Tax=Novipirellula galeiformis TaxID=2528004 RepID=A0A5C6CU85_9BACT|nr:hypothetical protein Pla52o_04490 [Novipirellula galeiformis]
MLQCIGSAPRFGADPFFGFTRRGKWGLSASGGPLPESVTLARSLGDDSNGDSGANHIHATGKGGLADVQTTWLRDDGASRRHGFAALAIDVRPVAREGGSTFSLKECCGGAHAPLRRSWGCCIVVLQEEACGLTWSRPSVVGSRCFDDQASWFYLF